MVDTKFIRKDVLTFGSLGVAEEDIISMCDELDYFRTKSPKLQRNAINATVEIRVDGVGSWKANAVLPIPEETKIEMKEVNNG